MEKHTNNQMQKKPKDFGQENGNQKNIIKGQYDKTFRRAQKGPESGNIHRFTQKDTKKISNRKTPGRNGIHSFWVKKLTPIHDRRALEMNKCLQGAHLPI